MTRRVGTVLIVLLLAIAAGCDRATARVADGVGEVGRGRERIWDDGRGGRRRECEGKRDSSSDPAHVTARGP